MKAIILAGGMGTRLGLYTKNLPKGLLPFLGKSLIERQIEVLRRNGIRDISIVTGYKAEAFAFSDVTYFHNPNYKTTNMVETLFCAEEKLSGEVLICYGDVIYEDKTIQQLIESPTNIGVAVDTDYWEYWSARSDNPMDDIESLVVDSENNITSIGIEGCDIEDAQVRYIGLVKLSAAGVETLKSVYYTERSEHINNEQPWLGSKSFLQGYLTSLLQAIINSGTPVEAVPVSRGWLEFDTTQDYERALLWHKNGSLKKFISLKN